MGVAGRGLALVVGYFGGRISAAPVCGSPSSGGARWRGRCAQPRACPPADLKPPRSAGRGAKGEISFCGPRSKSSGGRRRALRRDPRDSVREVHLCRSASDFLLAPSRRRSRRSQLRVHETDGMAACCDAAAQSQSRAVSAEIRRGSSFSCGTDVSPFVDPSKDSLAMASTSGVRPSSSARRTAYTTSSWTDAADRLNASAGLERPSASGTFRAAGGPSRSAHSRARPIRARHQGGHPCVLRKNCRVRSDKRHSSSRWGAVGDGALRHLSPSHAIPDTDVPTARFSPRFWSELGRLTAVVARECAQSGR